MQIIEATQTVYAKRLDAVMLTAEQLRGSRAMLRLSVEDLAAAAGIGPATIKRMEASTGMLGSSKYTTLERLRKALEDAGVIFNEDGSIRLDEHKQSGTAG
jgi:predicted transcriptional regulator